MHTEEHKNCRLDLLHYRSMMRNSGKFRSTFMCLFTVMLLLFSFGSASYVFAETHSDSSYIVKKGDSLYSIAREVLGDETRWQELYELNKESISDPRLIYSGQKLDLPAAASGQTDEERAAEIAKEYIAQAEVEEPAVTSLLREAESDTAYLEGLENRFKSQESLTRKILTNSQEDNMTLEEAAAKIADTLRYTLCIQDDEYVDTVDETLKKLTEAGCSVVKFKNTWGGDLYKGINTQLTTASGYLFELQFHTPASFEAKTVEHTYYEIRRDPDTSEEERDRLEALSAEVYQKVPVPEGAPEYRWNE